MGQGVCVRGEGWENNPAGLRNSGPGSRTPEVWAIRIWSSVKPVRSVWCSWSPLSLYSTCSSVLLGIIFA